MSNDCRLDDKFCNSKNKQNHVSRLPKERDLTSKSVKQNTEIDCCHKNNHEYEIKCKYCCSTFKDFQAQVNHVCKPYKCVLCCEQFLYDYQLKMHEIECNEKHIDETKTDDSFHCRCCDSVFETSDLLSQHESSCFKNKTNECNICNKKLIKLRGEICKMCKQKANGKKYSPRHNNLSHSVCNTSVPSKIHAESSEFSDINSNSKMCSTTGKKYFLRRSNSLRHSLCSDISSCSKKQIQSSETNDISSYNDSNVNPIENTDIYTNGEIIDNIKTIGENDSKQLGEPHVKNMNNQISGSRISKRKLRKSKVGSSNDSTDENSEQLIEDTIMHTKEEIVGNLDKKIKNPKQLQDSDVFIKNTNNQACSSQVSKRKSNKSESATYLSNDAASQNDTSDPLRHSDVFINNTEIEACSSRVSRRKSSKSVSADLYGEAANESENHKIKSRNRTPSSYEFSNMLKKNGIKALEWLKKIIKKNGISPTELSEYINTVISSDFNNSNVPDHLKDIFKLSDNIETALSNNHLTSPLSSYGEVVRMKRKRVDESDSEKSLRINNVKQSKREKCKNVLTNNLKVQEKAANEQNTDIEMSDLESSSTGSNNKINKTTSVSTKIKKNRVKKQNQSSKTPENLISSNEMVFNNFSSDKVREPIMLNSFERELEISASTLNTPEDLSDSHELIVFNGGGIKQSSDALKNRNSVLLEHLLGALPDSNSGFLIRISGNTCDNFRCPKCKKLFKQVKPGAKHYSSCCKSLRLKKQTSVLLNEVEFFCTVCYYHCSMFPDLYTHKKNCVSDISNSNISIFKSIQHYGNSLNVCNECGYSCLSIHSFNQHSCEKRLKQLTTCIVDIKKLTPSDLNAIENLSKVQCHLCDAIFYDDVSFENHVELHFDKELKFAKTSIIEGKACIRKEVKKIIKTAPFDSVDSVIENVVKPISEITSAADPENFFPYLKIDFTIPYEKQELLTKATKEFFTTKTIADFINAPKCEKSEGMSEDEENFDFNKLKNFECKCKGKHMDPSLDIKPCRACLNEYMEKYINKELSESAEFAHKEKQSDAHSINNASDILIDNVTGGISVPSDSVLNFPNLFTSPSSSSLDTTSCIPSTSDIPSTSEASDAVGTNLTKIASDDISSHSSSVTGTSNNDLLPPFLRSGDNFREHDLTSSDHNENELDSLDAECANEILYYLNHASDVSKDCTTDISFKLPTDSRQMQSDYNTAVPSTSHAFGSDIHEEKVSKIAFSNDISNYIENSSNELYHYLNFLRTKPGIYTKNETENASFLEHLNSLLTSSMSANISAAQTSDEQEIVSSEQKQVNFPDFLKMLMDFEVDLDIYFGLGSVTVCVQCIFNKNTTYSAYAIKSSRMFICASCLEQLPGSDLIEHLINEHGETSIIIVVM